MIRLLSGDCRTILPTLPDASVQCVVCSPPYYGLRDYQTGTWEGGDAACEHIAGNTRGDTGAGTHNGSSAGFHGGSNIGATRQFRDTCGKCGARRIDAQIGLEATPEAFIAELVAVFREVRRVLRDDGTVWLNMGDSYANSGHACPQTSKSTINVGPKGIHYPQPYKAMPGKPKDLLLMPARVALALQADGWWVRSDIIWAKPNPMPESCRDRPTSAHEHVFLLSKRAKYFYDNEAIREEVTGGAHPRGNGVTPKSADPASGIKANASYHAAINELVTSRSCRNVWTIATEAFPAAHFATFPSALAERCIRAGTSERGCCSACGAPWVRVTETDDPHGRLGKAFHDHQNDLARGQRGVPAADGAPVKRTTGWTPSCTCGAETRPCVVLDPFSGAGTALLVADRLGRDAVGIDLSHAYVEMARERLHADCPLFADISPPPAEPPEDERMADLFAMAAD